MSISRLFSGSVVFTSLLFSAVSSANAVTLVDSTSDRAGFSFPNGDVSKSSYDGAAFNAFSPFAAFTTPELLKVNAFTGQALGSQLDFTILSQSAAFDGTSVGYSDKFGVIGDDDQFVSILDAAGGVGTKGSILQGSSESLKFALNSPEGLFTSNDASNPDGAAHILAMKVNKSGEFEIDPTSLRGTPPIKFNFLEGDLVLFIEDMRASGNLTSFLVPASGDFDYNDMVVVVRQTQVPEPATMTLLGIGLLGAAARRKSRATA